MDLENPFGEAFGRASNRDELINSAQELYYRLLRLSPGSFSLPFSVLSVLVENDDGTIDRNLKRSIETIFRADRDGEIPFLAFVQSCDVVYRKLRYFRASVGNASVIDKVLESILNGLYAFGLTVVIMSLLNFNPWPLLVSISTLLVSFAFAIGPTAAKAIEVRFLLLLQIMEQEHRLEESNFLLFNVSRVFYSLLALGRFHHSVYSLANGRC